MKYELMFPDQIRKSIKESWPVVLPLGVLEYHAEHCAVGTDTLLVMKALELLETEMALVILPPFYYGAASYAVEPPANNGSIQISANTLLVFARDLFQSLLRIGFRNIHVIIHHQSENFTAGMPTDLAFRLAAREVIFEFKEKTDGAGWWGRAEMDDYYAKQAQGEDCFNWIQVHPLMDTESMGRFPVDHAGKQETALMMAFCPEGVDLRKFSAAHWYCRAAVPADPAYGQAAREVILKELRAVLQKG